jgi:hypothetical protein
MKIFVFLSFPTLFFIVSCTADSTKNKNAQQSVPQTKTSGDTLDESSHDVTKIIEENLPKPITNIDSFLLNPVDLYAFKQRVGSSNSGGGDQRLFYFRPSYRGMYYSFFLFSRGGYRGTNKERTLFRENGLRITTYKRLNKYQYQFLDPTEELIDLEARLNNIYMPELTFVGLDTLTIKKLLGEPDFRKNNCFVYTHKDRVLLLGLRENWTDWLRYTLLKKPLSDDKEFDGLYELGNTFS